MNENRNIHPHDGAIRTSTGVKNLEFMEKENMLRTCDIDCHGIIPVPIS